MTCITEDTKVHVGIRKVFRYQNGKVRILVGKLKIYAHPSHSFRVFSKGTSSCIKAQKITPEGFMVLPVYLARSKGELFMTDKLAEQLK